MKKFLLAGFLLCASSSFIKALAQEDPAGLPAPVQNAYARVQAQLAQQGLVISEVRWVHEQNKFVAKIKMVRTCTGCCEEFDAVFLVGRP